MRRTGPVLVGFYAWTAAAAFGVVLIDIVWASQLPTGSTATAEVRDFLLGMVALVVLSAVAAIGASWEGRRTRYLLAASLFVVVVGLLTPALLSGVIEGTEDALGVRIGPWVRIGEAGLASMLAFLGLWESWRNA